MMSLLIKLCFRNKGYFSETAAKKRYASLSSVVGIILNLFLCTAKIVIGFSSHSVAISADGFNNLSDAGMSLITLLGFHIARYGKGKIHPFGHGRFEWIMGIFTSLAVVLMGIKLVHTSAQAIVSPAQPLFSAAVVIILALSIATKGYMYLYNKRFARITDSETLKATAADCISDSVATFAVLVSTVISHLTDWEIDGYCGVLVSIFIIVTGVKSLWEVLGRIMGRAGDQETVKFILQSVETHPEIRGVHNLMIHDYGFGYFVVSMRVEGYKKDSEKLYVTINEISYDLYQKFRCDCFIQVDYLIDNEALADQLTQRINLILKKYGGQVGIDHFRLVESGPYTNIVFDLLYPAELQKSEEEIYQVIEKALGSDNPQYHTIIQGIMRRKRGRSCCEILI